MSGPSTADRAARRGGPNGLPWRVGSPGLPRRIGGGSLSLQIGGAVVAAVAAFALLGPLVAPHAPEATDMANRFAGPTPDHWLGTDNFGRDLWVRMALGARLSLTVALASIAIASVLGTLVGLLTGYLGGWVDLLLMRVVDVFLGFPPIVLALAIVAALGPGPANLVVSLSAVFWAEYARLVRAVTLVEREQGYVEAARAIGASRWRIMVREVLPNAIGPVIVLATLGLGTAIIAESGLSFLGFGVDPATPSWGWALATGTRYLRQDPWLSTVAGSAIMITVLGFNLFGDGLRDLLDPRDVARRAQREEA